MMASWTYPYEIREEEGAFHAYSSTVPEAIASGATREEARAEMAEALAAVVRARIIRGLDLAPPSPSADARETESVTLPAELATKATVYTAWKASGLTKVALAAKLGWAEKEIRRVLDPNYRSGLDRMAEVAHVLGRDLVIGWREAA